LVKAPGMRVDGQTTAISTTVAMQATVSIDDSLSLLRIHLVAVFIFLPPEKIFPRATTLARRCYNPKWPDAPASAFHRRCSGELEAGSNEDQWTGD
jgi:hypothetical protein